MTAYAVLRYLQLQARVFIARAADDDETEEDLLAEMSDIWYRMSQDEIDTVRRHTAGVVQGTVSKDNFITRVWFSGWAAMTGAGDVTPAPRPRQHAHALDIDWVASTKAEASHA